MEFISGFLEVHSIVSLLLGLAAGAFTSYRIIRFVARKEIRIFRNLQRTVYLLQTDDSRSLDREKLLLSKNCLFTVHEDIINIGSDKGVLESIEKFSVLVIAYSEGYQNYAEAIARAKRDSIPVIVLAEPGRISPEHLAKFGEYPYFEMCNTTARLLTTIFNLSVVTPYEES